MVGRDAEVTVNAALELLSSLISSAEVPGFLMEIVCVAPLPIFTSPKSMDDGVVTTVFEAFGENALESDPQPVSPVPRKREQARNVIVPSLFPGARMIGSTEGGQIDSLREIRNEEVRFLFIRASPKRNFGQPMQKTRQACAERIYKAASV